MRTVITGGAGFLGAQLATRLLAAADRPGDSRSERRVVVADRVAGGVGVTAAAGGPGGPAGDERCRVVEIDLTDPAAALDELVAGADAVVHLASVVSADAEGDPERAWQLNVEATRRLLAACARSAPGCVFLTASSVAVFGGGAEPAGDRTKAVPASTYGMTKVVLELLVNEATRRGQVDGRIARLPTVIVRPGRPNLAASSFASGVFREPLNGIDMTLPVGPAVGMVVIGHRSAVAGLEALLAVPADRLGADRAVNLPGLEVRVAEIVAACRRVGASHGRSMGAITEAPDPAVEAIVASWPSRWDAGRARELGLPADRSLDEIVAHYLEDFGPARG